jgi:2,3-bisphosphoglycerate-dependent phosphoglycerate mutase
VRHAEKRKDQGDNPDLTEEGVKRAQHLGLILSQERLDMAFSTNFKRTVKTAEEVRKQAEKAPPGSSYPPAMQDIWLDETLRTGAGKRFLVVGHQNTVPQLLNQLTGGTAYEDIPDNDYGRLYIAVTKGIGQTEVMEFRY